MSSAPCGRAPAKEVRLEPLERRHEEAIGRLVSDPEVAARTERIPHPYPSDGARQFVRHATRLRSRDRGWLWAVTVEGETVGACGLERHPVDPSRAELGYWIGRPYWGRGYATAAARKAIRFGFREKGLRSIRARCLTSNEASQRVLEKAGMRRVAIHRHDDPRWSADDWLLVLEVETHGS